MIYLITWTPYALISLVYVIIPIPQVLDSFPTLFAKCSLVYPAIFYFKLMNKETKKFFDRVLMDGSKLLRSIRYPSIRPRYANDND